MAGQARHAGSNSAYRAQLAVGGQITLRRKVSQGYSSWPPVAIALDRIAIAHSGRFTKEVVFRCIEDYGERNGVREGSGCTP